LVSLSTKEGKAMLQYTRVCYGRTFGVGKGWIVAWDSIPSAGARGKGGKVQHHHFITYARTHRGLRRRFTQQWLVPTL